MHDSSSFKVSFFCPILPTWVAYHSLQKRTYGHVSLSVPLFCIPFLSGDPLRFHAYFIVVCISMDESMPLCDVLAIARLGSNVKKTVLLCSSGGSQEDDGEEVVYTSLQWSGMV